MSDQSTKRVDGASVQRVVIHRQQQKMKLNEIKTEKWQVMPTSITRQSLLVLPDHGYHTPKISLQMDTQLARVLAHSANVLPQVAQSLHNLLADAVKYPQLELCDHHKQRLIEIIGRIEEVEMANDKLTPLPLAGRVECRKERWNPK